MLKCLKFLVCICLCTYLFCALNMVSEAEDTLQINMASDNVSPVSGEEFVIRLNFVPSKNINVAAYRLKVNFDSSKITYKGLYSNIINDDFKSYVKGDKLTILYVTTEKGFSINAGTSKTVLELNFKVLSSCDIGSTEISATIDGLCDYDINEIPLPVIEPVIINVVQTGEGNCDLATLALNEYKLVPSFSSDITSYSVEVPYSKSTIEFTAVPLDEEATVKANRKTLKSAGTTTDIDLTVTSADKKTKKVYKVKVNRLDKESSQIKMLNNISNDDEGFIVNEGAHVIKNEDTEIDESIVRNNDIAKQNFSPPLVVTENAFNFIIFFISSAVIIFFAVFILKRK